MCCDQVYVFVVVEVFSGDVYVGFGSVVVGESCVEEQSQFFECVVLGVYELVVWVYVVGDVEVVQFVVVEIVEDDFEVVVFGRVEFSFFCVIGEGVLIVVFEEDVGKFVVDVGVVVRVKIVFFDVVDFVVVVVEVDVVCDVEIEVIVIVDVVEGSGCFL